MPARNRRARLLVLVIFGGIAVFLFSGNKETFGQYKEYVKEKAIGGGAVLRPKLGLPQQREDEVPLVALGPKPRPIQDSMPSRPPSVPQPLEPVTGRTTTEQQRLRTSLTTSASIKPTPPARLGDSGLKDAQDFEYSDTASVSSVRPIVHWQLQSEHFPLSSTIALPTGTSKPFPRVQRAINKLSMYGADAEKLDYIKAAASHAWQGYRQSAFGSDEVRPVTQGVKNSFNGWGATLVDGLDTLWIMGLKDEFDEAVEAVGRIDFTTSHRADIPLFETVIRYLGGLIAAYDVSGKQYRVLLDKAVELGEVLYSAFDTPNRVPVTYYRWQPNALSKPQRAGMRVVLAEIGTLSMEFTRLAQLTGEPKYYDAIARITDLFEDFQNNTNVPGMWPTTLDSSGCKKMTYGSRGTATTGLKPQLEQHAVPDGTLTKLDKYGKAGILVGGDHGEDAMDLRQPAHPAAAGVAGRRQKRQLDPTPDRTAGQEFLKSAHEMQVQTKLKDQLGLSEEDTCEPAGLQSAGQSLQEVYTLSGASDSMYEYLPKQYLLLGGLVEKYKTMYLDSAATAIEKLLYRPMTPEGYDILMSGELKLMPNYSEPYESRGYIEKFHAEAAHLTCFAGGMFAMGGVLFGIEEHVDIGAKLTDGCVWAYNSTTTGIMPEGATLMTCEDTWGECPWNATAYSQALDPYEDARMQVYDERSAVQVGENNGPIRIGPPLNRAPKPHLSDKPPVEARPPPPVAIPIAAAPAAAAPPKASSSNDATWTPASPLPHDAFVAQKILEERLPPGYLHISSRHYILRPEAIESVFYLWRITGDPHWRDAAWTMFLSIERHTRVQYGHSAVDDVTKIAPEPEDSMESFWLAETLKYFWLIFDDASIWSLDEWVLNTEAHLFRRPEFEFVT